MNTNKFKAGDKIRCVDNSRYCNQLTLGKEYTVVQDASDVRYVHIKPDHQTVTSGYKVERFELVTDVLTPEEVLQYFKEGRQHELEYTQPNGVVLGTMNEYTSVKYILEGTWRVKPAPEIITLNGKRYQALEV